MEQYPLGAASGHPEVPTLDVMAAEMVDNFEATLEPFRSVAESLVPS